MIKILNWGIGIAVLALTAWLLIRLWPADETAIDGDGVELVDHSSLLQLTPAKASVAAIRTLPVTRGSLELSRVVPARFAYDDRRHVAVRAPADGVIDLLWVKPGDVVEAGQVLAILRSPSIGSARSEVLRRQAELEIIIARHAQLADIHTGVMSLVEALRAGEPPDEIERKLSHATLGQYRGQLLANYSKLRLATQLADAATGSGGVIVGRIVQERVSERQQAAAELEGAVENAIFETDQSVRSAASEVEAARRNLSIAQQELAMLLGIETEQAGAMTISPNEGALTRLEIRSPISATVERLGFSATERVKSGDELFIVADTTQLWVEADIRGQDWDAIDVEAGNTVTVTTPALPDVRTTATVYFVGREVDPMTGAIPLVAEISNEQAKFRPGLFARVEIPFATVTDVIAISRSAIVDLQGETSVFVAKDGGFAPVTIQTGASTPERIEITAGLAEGQEIVVNGAFILKSELLLEGEE